jgi:uncharacterized protein (TIGR02996 family)
MPLDTNHPEFRSFVQQMRADPQDDTRRLVLCDWLEEKFPEVGLHVFIRSMIEVAKTDYGTLGLRGWDKSLRPLGSFTDVRHFRAAEMALKRTWAAWPLVQIMHGYNLHWRWHRGTLDRVVLAWGLWARHWPDIIAFGPVNQVILVDQPPFYHSVGHSQNRLVLGQVIVGREEASAKAEVFMASRDWEATDGLGRSVYQRLMIQEVLGQVWPAEEVHEFAVSVRPSPLSRGP